MNMSKMQEFKEIIEKLRSRLSSMSDSAYCARGSYGNLSGFNASCQEAYGLLDKLEKDLENFK